MTLAILLLAPTDGAGGIASWARIFREAASPELVIEAVDTAQRYLVLGSRSPCRRVLLGGRDAVGRIVEVVRRVRRSPRPDVVYLACAPSLGFWVRDLPLIALLRWLGVPTVAHLHGGSVAGFFGSSAGLRWLNGTALAQATAIICITEQVNRAAEGIFGPGKVSYIPNMLSHCYLVEAAAQDRKHGERPVVLHVAWQAPPKGTLEVVRVASKVPDADFVLVGAVPPDARPEIDRTMAEVGDPTNVRFAGPVFGPELGTLYAQSDVFLLPSHGEGFPMVVLEAMSHGVPVLATDVGEIGVILGVGSRRPAGRVFARSEASLVDDLVAATRELLVDRDINERMGRAGRERVEQLFDAAKVVPAIKSLLAGVASGRGTGSG